VGRPRVGSAMVVRHVLVAGPVDISGLPWTTSNRRRDCRADRRPRETPPAPAHINYALPKITAGTPGLVGNRRPSRRLSAARVGRWGWPPTPRPTGTAVASMWALLEPKRASSREILVRSGFYRQPRSVAQTAGAPVFTGLQVGVAGFEPTAPRSQSECATKLRHTPATERPVYGGYRRSNPAQPLDCTGRYDIGAPGQPPHPDRGRSSVAESQSSKLITRVRFPSPARGGGPGIAGLQPLGQRRRSGTTVGLVRK
jgi:hypothetical protein